MIMLVSWSWSIWSCLYVLSNIWSSIHEEIMQHRGTVEKRVAYNKTCISFDYVTLHNQYVWRLHTLQLTKLREFQITNMTKTFGRHKSDIKSKKYIA